MQVIQHHNNMKAIEINGEIKIFNTLPSTWNGKKHYMGGFEKSPIEVLEEEGFYDVVIPNYDSRIQKLGDIYFDSASKTFVKDVLDKTWPQTLTELKEHKLIDLKDHTNNLLLITDWYYIRKLSRNIEVPQEIQDERTAILESHDNHETAITALTEKAEVVKYEFR